MTDDPPQDRDDERGLGFLLKLCNGMLRIRIVGSETKWIGHTSVETGNIQPDAIGGPKCEARQPAHIVPSLRWSKRKATHDSCKHFLADHSPESFPDAIARSYGCLLYTSPSPRDS